jgi:hypothetical protein
MPASDEVGALAEQIKRLLDSLEARLGFRPVDAAISVPHLAALYQDDILDACEYAKLTYFELPQWFLPLLWETPAAVGGYGLGLCKHYQDIDECQREEQNMPKWNLLTVHYSHTALTTSLTPMYTAYGVFEPEYRHAENFSLGHDALATALNEKTYWTAVHRELREMFHRHIGFDEPDMIIVTGDSADDATFQGVLEDAVMSKHPLVFHNDTIFAVAKGTAELRMRGGFIPRYNLTRLNSLQFSSMDL